MVFPELFHTFLLSIAFPMGFSIEIPMVPWGFSQGARPFRRCTCRPPYQPRGRRPRSPAESCRPDLGKTGRFGGWKISLAAIEVYTLGKIMELNESKWRFFRWSFFFSWVLSFNGHQMANICQCNVIKLVKYGVFMCIHVHSIFPDHVELLL